DYVEGAIASPVASSQQIVSKETRGAMSPTGKGAAREGT
ncbi:hypothetical protein TNCV_1717351, partial [Trichonephila clavipes]